MSTPPAAPSATDARAAGLAARAEGRHEAALAHFREAARLDPHDRWSRHDAGVELRSLGRAAEAADAFRHVAEGTPLAYSVRALGTLSRAAGRREEALACLRAAALLAPADPWFALDAAVEAGALGRAGEAEAAFEALAAAHPGFLPGWRERARACLARGDREAACRHLEAALALAPGDAALSRDLAETLLALGRLDEAETRLARLLVAEPGQFAACLGLARIARARGAPDVAAAHLRAAEARLAGDAFARMAVAGEWLALGETGRARALYAEIGARPDAPAAALVELSAILRRGEGPDAAGRALERAVAAEPSHARALLLLADARREAGRSEEAGGLYDRALAARPGFYWALVGKAALARGLGDTGEARRLLLRAMESDPAEGHAEIELANDLAAGGDAPAARALLARVPPASPRARQAAMAAARLYRDEGDWPAAAAAFEAVAAGFADDAEALVEATEDRLRCGEPEAAESRLAEAAAIAPGLPAVLEAQGRRALRLDEPDEALAFFERAEAADAGRLWPTLAAARIEASLGSHEAAGRRFAAAEARFGPRAEIALARAEIETRRGETGAAAARFAEARRHFPRHFGLWQAEAIAAVEAGRFAEAEAALEAAPATSAPERGRVAFVRSLLHAARWDFAAAVEAGEAALAALPGDGWVANRLVHAALLDLDVERARRHLETLAALEAGANRLRGRSANPSQSHYGQILDEFRMDGEALAALRAAGTLEPEARAGRLASLVEANPDNTAAAIAFFVDHRRAGRLDATPVPAGLEAAIPRAVHQYWDDGAPPADLAPLIASWAEPGFRHRLWSDEEARRFLAELPDPAILAAYERAAEPAMKADLFRLALLDARGGVYADADDRCLGGLAALISGGHGLVCYQEDLGTLGNDVLACVPGHPVIARALRLGVEAVNRGDTDILWLATGPGLLTRAAAQVFAAQPVLMAQTLVLDRHALAAHVAVHCMAAYKTTERHWSRTAFGRARRRLPQAASGA